MSSSFTYASLKNVVVSDVADTSEAFSLDFDTMLRLGEDTCVVDLALDIWKASVDVTLPGAEQEIAIPDGFLRILSVFHTLDGERTFLQPRSYEYLIAYWPSTSDTGAPKYFSSFSATRFYVAPTPDIDYTGLARGIKRPTSLVTDTGGTYLSQNCGRLLYLATLINAEQSLVSDERIGMWKAEYAEELGRKRVELAYLITPEYRLPALTEA